MKIKLVALIIYEQLLSCSDCQFGSETHNQFHLPYSEMNYAIHPSTTQPANAAVIEEYTEDEVNSSIEELRLDGFGVTNVATGELEKYSWTQFAIRRCNA